ncbi:MAG TPA: response regulator [Luteolibacter sp.]|nr:response regulator [Luteolibacter sp.]
MTPATDSPNPNANHILIVDDNTAIHEDFRRILMSHAGDDGFADEDAAFFGTDKTAPIKPGFHLEFASQGQEALEMVRKAIRNGERFAVVFMDVRMPPGWDGIETAKHLWEEDPDLQIVICTAYSDYSWDAMVEKLGQTDKLLILRKPFDVIEAEQAAHAFSKKWALLQQTRRHSVFLEQTMDLSPSMVLWINEDGSLNYANQAACRQLQYESDSLLQADVRDLLGGMSGEAWSKLWNKTVNRKNHKFETQLATRKGETIPIEAITTILDFQDKRVMCLTAQDISERLQTLRELSSARDAALESARMKSQFLANMSHEIRTPMNGVLGMAELLAKTELTPLQKEYVGIINQSGGALLSIINDILDSAKIESGKIEFQKVPFDLREVIKGAMQTVQANAAKKGLTIWSSIDPEITTRFLGDPGRLRQVLINLVGNAVKFTHQGEVSLMVECVSQDEISSRLHIAVKDTGIGIEPAQLRHIFQPFTQADSTSKRSYGGTGLGLTISSQIIQAMGGSIEVSSRLGQGSVFSFNITLEKTTRAALESDGARTLRMERGVDYSAAEPEATWSWRATHPSGDMPRILLVEDNDVNRRVTLMQLRQIGCDADVATNGKEALKALDQVDYDVVLMDCQMPVMDGFEATREIRRRHRRPIRIIALTANAMKEDRSRCLKAGMDDYLSKPLNSESLAAALGFSNSTPDPEVSVAVPAPPQLGDAEPAVDFERLREVTGDDPGLLQEISRQYLEQAEEILDEMEDAIHCGDHDRISKLAHKLAGSSATCGMVGVVAQLRAIEALKSNQIAPVVALHQQCKMGLMRIRQALENPPY